MTGATVHDGFVKMDYLKKKKKNIYLFINPYIYIFVFLSRQPGFHLLQLAAHVPE